MNQLAWLGEVPKRWCVVKLRQILRPFSEKNHSELPLLSVVREKGVIVRNVADKEENHNYVPEDLSGYKRVKRGQFAMNKMKAWQGSYGVSNYDGIVSPAYFVFDIDYDIDYDFFNAAIRSKAYVNYFGQASDGIRVGQWDLSMQRMKEIPFLVPPRDEQEQIVRFLDWKVSAINRLINIKHKGIVFLDELKKSSCSRIVTQGLSECEMKSTHNAWMPKVPRHWNEVKLRNILKSFSEKNRPDLPLLSVVREKGVIERNVESKEENHNYIPDDLSNYKRVKKGQFAMNKMKAWQGSYGVSQYDGIVSPAYFVFDIDYDIDHDFFNTAIRSKAYVSYFGQASDGIRVGQWDLSMQRMKEISFFVPPYKEQQLIVKFLEKYIAKIDNWSNIIHEQIKHLQDLKARLISDVVTGKIDVRGVEVPEVEFVDEAAGEEDFEVDNELFGISE